MQTAQRHRTLQHRTMHPGAEPPRQPLLVTKLQLPQSRPDLTPRPHLWERLTQGLCTKLTLVVAPAGFGKTTLVSQWLEQLNHSSVKAPLTRESPNPKAKIKNPQSAWLTLDSGDNDPVRFWRYLITACQRFDGTVGQTALALLQTAQQPPWEHLLTLLINDLARLPGQHMLVLEDYHVITAPLLQEQVAFLLDYLPATLHLLITTRTEPPLPLARWRAQSLLQEVPAADLRFSAAETTAFFQHTLAGPLEPHLLQQIEARTEGWVTGLRLLALLLQKQPTANPPLLEHLLATFTGSHEHIFTYFIQEVLNAQPPAHQAFLLRTSLLGVSGARLSAALCDAVTGRTDSADLLEQLKQANLFLVPLADDYAPGQQRLETALWYRYHALFAEALLHAAQQRLGAATLRQVAEDASHWYEAHGFLSEAIEAALTAQAFARAATLIEQAAVPEFMRNEYHTLRRWLTQLPEAVLHAHPALCLLYAMATLFTADRQAPATMALLQQPLAIAEAHWRALCNDDLPPQATPSVAEQKLGEVLAFRSFVLALQGEQAPALALAKEALTYLPATEKEWRGMSLNLIGMDDLLAGRVQAAQQIFSEALTLWQSTQNIYGILVATLALGEVYTKQGAWSLAAQCYHQVLTAVERAPLQPAQKAMRMGGAHLGLATVALEGNDLVTAEQEATQAVSLGQQVGYADLIVGGSLLLARIHQARGAVTAAQTIVHDLLLQPPPRQSAALRQAIELEGARLALATGDLAAVERWAITSQAQPEGTRGQAEQAALLLARFYLSTGAAQAALDLLQPWQPEAQAQGRHPRALEMLVLQSLAYYSLGHLAQAKAVFHQLLTQAQPAGYRRLLLDEGVAVLPLLRLVWPEVKTDAVRAYVHRLLADLDPNPAPAPSAAALLIEPLSPQEQRVLQLLSSGRSNTEIANELIVSVNTVKTQLQSIYRKLNVNSRHEARTAAQQLKLA